VDPDFKTGNERYYKTYKKPAKFIGNIDQEFRIPTHSKAFKPSNIIGELEWKPNFTKYSKDNNVLPRAFREYFDKPINYDVRGFHYCNEDRNPYGKRPSTTKYVA